MEEKNKNQNSYRLFLIMATSTAILLVSPVLILLAVGYFADKFFHTAPIYMILGGIIGFISGMINVFRMTQMIQKRKKRTML